MSPQIILLSSLVRCGAAARHCTALACFRADCSSLLELAEAATVAVHVRTVRMVVSDKRWSGQPRGAITSRT